MKNTAEDLGRAGQNTSYMQLAHAVFFYATGITPAMNMRLTGIVYQREH
jgi:hypothetical protein